MKNKRTLILAGLVFGLFVVTSLVKAQQPAPSPSPKKTPESTSVQAGEDAGNYTAIASIEFGYRGISVAGDQNKYRSDLNYKAGPRVFDSSFLLTAKDGKGSFFDTIMVTSSGWGGDPHGNLRISIENPKWYRFDGTYRKFKYFRFVNNLANPNWYSLRRLSVSRRIQLLASTGSTHEQSWVTSISACCRRTTRSGSTLATPRSDTRDQHLQTTTPVVTSLTFYRRPDPAQTIFALAPTVNSARSTYRSCKASVVSAMTVLLTLGQPWALTEILPLPV